MKSELKIRRALSVLDEVIDLLVLLACMGLVLWVLGTAVVDGFTDADVFHLFLAAVVWYLVGIKHAVMGRIS